jgi:glycine cleavage system regulatory protein
VLRVVYEDGRGILRQILALSTRHGFSLVNFETRQLEHDIQETSAVAVTLELRGQPTVGPLAVALSDLDGVFEVATADHGRNGE